MVDEMLNFRNLFLIVIERHDSFDLNYESIITVPP